MLPIAILLLSLASCVRMGEGSIKLPTNPILTGGLGWAVVKEAYVRLKESPSDGARDLDHLRRGGVFRLDSRRLGTSVADSRDSSATAVWYSIESDGSKGWIRDSELDIFSSQAQAERAAESYR